MIYSIPENLTRLQNETFVTGAGLDVPDRGEIIRTAAKAMAEGAVRKILRDCVETRGDYMGYPGQTLKLDVYVLAPHELNQLLADALREGQRQAEEWRAPL